MVWACWWCIMTLNVLNERQARRTRDTTSTNFQQDIFQKNSHLCMSTRSPSTHHTHVLTIILACPYNVKNANDGWVAHHFSTCQCEPLFDECIMIGKIKERLNCKTNRRWDGRRVASRLHQHTLHVFTEKKKEEEKFPKMIVGMCMCSVLKWGASPHINEGFF